MNLLSSAGATFRVMLLAFLRDPAGWVLTLLLPPVVFVIFASVFGAGASGSLDYSIAIADTVGTPQTAALATRISDAHGHRVQSFGRDVDAWRRAVAQNRADVGLLIRGPMDGGEHDTPPLLVLVNRNRSVVADVFTVRLDRLMAAGPGAVERPPQMVVQKLGPTQDPQPAYYAGAVSILFAFFSAVHAAMGGIDDRRSGLASRAAMLAGGAMPILLGRMAWLTVQGLVQAAVVFAVGTFALGIDAFALPLAWLLTATLSAAVAAGVALALTGLCHSRKQAEPLTTFVLLVAAALGGSMAPRFLMPHAFQVAGWFTPHAWVIETYQAVVWRHVVDADVFTGWWVLAGIALAGLLIAGLAERSRRDG